MEEIRDPRVLEQLFKLSSKVGQNTFVVTTLGRQEGEHFQLLAWVQTERERAAQVASMEQLAQTTERMEYHVRVHGTGSESV